MTKEKLEEMAAAVRMGGKGSVRRTVKVHHKAAGGDDKKVQGTLKKLGVTPVNDIDEAVMMMNDGSGRVFKNPKVQASMQSQCFVVAGNYETKSAQEMLPAMLAQMQRQLGAMPGGAAAMGGAPAAEQAAADME